LNATDSLRNALEEEDLERAAEAGTDDIGARRPVGRSGTVPARFLDAASLRSSRGSRGRSCRINDLGFSARPGTPLV
jgi:hypothetical protein